MTDSTAPVRGGKRERLVASAGDLLHRQGAFATTLVQVAEAAGVPPGNVYYYFKTKDDLIRAVIEARTEQVRAIGAVEDMGDAAVRCECVEERGRHLLILLGAQHALQQPEPQEQQGGLRDVGEAVALDLGELAGAVEALDL